MNQPLEVTFSNPSLAHRRGDDDQAPVTTIQCDDCRRYFASDEVKLVDEAFLCQICIWNREEAEAEREEDCTCAMSGDTADASGCAAHNGTGLGYPRSEAPARKDVGRVSSQDTDWEVA